MASKKKQRPEHITGGYSSIPWVVMDSISFKGATDKAKSLLLALMRQHNGINNGRLHLAKKWLNNQGWTCDEGNRKATKELIERGLVIQTKWGGLNAGTNKYAITWYDITNYVGLDITKAGYQSGAWALCKLPPTARRKAPVKKQQERLDDRASTSSTTELVSQLASSTTEPEKPLLRTFTGSTTENNVVIPLLPVKKTTKRIVGLKGKSGILQSKTPSLPNLMH